MSWDDLRQTYDSVASAYEDRFIDELEDKPRDRHLLVNFAASVDDPVLDVGCGPGQVGLFVRDCGRTVAGIDLSPAMAELAHSRLDGAMAGDMRSLPCSDNSIGGIVAFYSLIHVPRSDLVVVLREFHRVLQPGGRLLATVHEGNGVVAMDTFLGHPTPFIATLFSKQELLAATGEAGLSVTLSEQRAPYPSESKTNRVTVEAMKA